MFPQISAKFQQTFHRISAPFPDAIKPIFANVREFSQNKKKTFATDRISELLNLGFRVLRDEGLDSDKDLFLKPVLGMRA